ncbi:MAG: PTS sugar transporter subunit IIA [Myxococcales bacterium]|nr:PTS sugar transporter subunit IIA [Myxococcales bacterium]
MTLTELLPARAILADLQGHSREELFAELCGPVSRETGIPVAELADALAEREQLASTALGSGIAVPHGVHAGLDRVVACFARARAGIEFGAPDGEPVQFFVALLRPPDAAASHLKALARVSQLLSNVAVREQLLSAPDAEAIHRIVREREVSR